MVSKNPNPSEAMYLDDPNGMALPAGLAPFADSVDELNKKTCKPYTITKSRESWTEPEHHKFLEALQMFDRDWKKIEAFVGSKTVIQKLKRMDPIDFETVLLLMRNLSINLTSPDSEDHRRLLASYEVEPEKNNYMNADLPTHA